MESQLTKYKQRKILKIANELGNEFERFTLNQLSDRIKMKGELYCSSTIIGILRHSKQFEIFEGCKVISFSKKNENIRNTTR